MTHLFVADHLLHMPVVNKSLGVEALPITIHQLIKTHHMETYSLSAI